MNKRIFTLLLLSSSLISRGQNTTSPYSVLGIGDMENKDFGRYFITGNTALSRRDDAAYNMLNPAALTALPYKTMHFDMAFRGRSSRFTLPSTGTNTAISKDFTMRQGTLAFKVTKKTGFALGIQPYSTVNFQYGKIAAISDGTDNYYKYTDGNGGINQAFFSIARSAGNHFSAGINAAWLFGAIQRNTTYYSEALSLNAVREDRDFYTGGLFKGGIQFYSNPLTNRKWKHTIGLTGSISTGLNGQLTSTYKENSTVLVTNQTNDRHFSLPLQSGLGYSATWKNKLTFSAEGNYYYWKYQDLDYKNSFTAPGYRLSAGMEYSIKAKTLQGLMEKSFIGWGIHTERSYMRINKQPLQEYAVSFGGGIHPSRSISLYTGVELGIRGDRAGQYREQYTQFIFGVTVKDIWLGTKRFGRYN